MKHSRMMRGICLPVMATAMLLTGCAANRPQPLYQWTGYQPAVYDYLKGEKAPQEQIDALEKALQDISGKGHMPPPGFHAQLGMLYASVGNDTQAMQEFESEKQLFPESSTYMDFLMKHKTKQP
ncbi:DUF4810 domain-containing protein [Paraburkholderia sp. 32]|uniref:DUF4810 domain-containing protein n=2 Tax=unclassified Paraburkholderia TaxID=2615204 RepID=UPI003D1FBD83